MVPCPELSDPVRRSVLDRHRLPLAWRPGALRRKQPLGRVLEPGWLRVGDSVLLYPPQLTRGLRPTMYEVLEARCPPTGIIVVSKTELRTVLDTYTKFLADEAPVHVHARAHACQAACAHVRTNAGWPRRLRRATHLPSCVSSSSARVGSVVDTLSCHAATHEPERTPSFREC